MSEVKGRNTSLELHVRKRLFADGFRYRVNDNRYPGKPDIVLTKYHAVIFIHGCFWHQHKGCSKSKRPTSNKDFWDKKLDDNINRDKSNIIQLKQMGWRVAIVWECALKKKQSFEETISSLEDWIRSKNCEITLPE